MASAKIGSLVYEVIADARKFKAGIKPLQNRITAFNKMLLATRTPLEQMQLELKGIAKVAKTGIQPTDAITRTVAQLSVATKGGSRSVKAFVKDLRTQANAIDVTGTFTGELTKKQRIQRDSLRKVADETEREVAKTRQALAVKRRAELQERRAARLTRQREELLRRVSGTIRRSITPMQKLQREQVNLTAAYKKGVITSQQYLQAMRMIRKEQDKVGRTTKQQNKQMNASGGIVLGMGKNLLGVAAAYKAFRFAQQSFSDSLELERAETQFEVFTGSASVAAGLTKQLRAFGRDTPLTFQGGAQAVKTLLQYGVQQEIVIDRMRRLADISGGSLESLQRLTLAFGQITANGRLQGQELRQLVEAGFNPLKTISDKTGESMSSLRKRMAEGAITINEVETALHDATSEGGRFNNMLDRIGSDTNYGRLQRLGGLLKDIAAQGLKPVADLAGAGAQGTTNAIVNTQKLMQKATTLKDLQPELRKLFGRQKGERMFRQAQATANEFTLSGNANQQMQSQINRLQNLMEFERERQRQLTGNKIPASQFLEIGKGIGEQFKKSLGAKVNLAKGVGQMLFGGVQIDVPDLLRQAITLSASDREQKEKATQDAAAEAKDRLQAEMDRFREESQQRKEAIEKSSVAAKSFQGGSVEEFNFLRDKQLQADKIEAERKIAQEESQQRESLNQELIEALKEIFGNNQQAPEIGVI